MKTRTLFITILLACALTFGCVNVHPSGNFSAGPETSHPGAGSRPDIPPGGGSPAVFIITPPFDGGVIAGNVTIMVRVADFSLVPPDGAGIPVTGHLIYYRDVVPPAVPSSPAFTRPGTFSVSSATTYTWQGIAPGTHTFAVQLVNPDNTPLNPPVIDAIDVTAVPLEMITSL